MNLTIKEAALYSGIGESKIREMVRETNYSFAIMNGNKTLIKRLPFEQHIESLKEV